MTVLQLDLQDGAVYQLDLFAAQRHQSDPSQFQLLTTVDFVSGEAVSALCAGGPPTISSGLSSAISRLAGCP